METKNLNITLQSVNNQFTNQMSESDKQTLFANVRTFDDFQDVLIRIVVEQKMHASIKNTRGNEIFSMRFSPSCKENVCCGWESNARLNKFIKTFEN